MPTIELIRNEKIVRQFTLTDVPFIVGREEGCDLVLQDEWISRRHLALRPMGSGQWEAVDLGSGNGSFIGSERIQSTILAHGDMVRLGSSLLRFHHEQAKPKSIDLSRPAAVELHLLSQLARALAENEGLKAELAVLATASRSGQTVPQGRVGALRNSILNPRLLMHFHHPHGRVGSALGRAPKERGVLLRPVFLGLGRIGDSLGRALHQLGRTRLRVVLESMVPAHRIKSPAKIVLRPQVDVSPLPLVDDLASGVDSLGLWLSGETQQASDLFLMLSVDLFGAGNHALSLLRDFMSNLDQALGGEGTVRKHAILVQDQSDETVDLMSWRTLIDSSLLTSVICVDRQRVAGFGSDKHKAPMMTVAGTIESAQRLTLHEPVLGAWREEHLGAFFDQEGFTTFGCSATDDLEDLGQAIEDLRNQALFHAGFGCGMARSFFLLAVVGSGIPGAVPDLAEQVKVGLEGIHDQWPQANGNLAVYIDSADSIRLFVGLSGQTKCQFSSQT
ncbi:MAG: hypothetical protein ACI97A_000198 [Planctomycetota bacterium]|jgi:hypothetical protein